MIYRIIQGFLLLSILITIIFVAILDERYVQAMFYCSIGMIAAIGLWLAKGTEEFIDHMNEQIKNK